MNPIDPKFNSLIQLNKCSVLFNQAGYILQLLLLRTMDWCHGRRFYNLINFIKMEKETSRPKRNIRWYMRFLHNKIGFFIVGLVLIYGLSGIIQTYRDTELLKHEVMHEVQLSANLPVSELGPKLKLRDLKPLKTEGDIVYYKEGTYNASTGMAKYVTKEWYSWILPFTGLHKSSSKSIAHYFTTIFAIALLFMSISAFWMFKPGTKLFSSGVYLTIAGIVAAIILLLLK
jgi:hypothetical protein